MARRGNEQQLTDDAGQLVVNFIKIDHTLILNVSGQRAKCDAVTTNPIDVKSELIFSLQLCS